EVEGRASALSSSEDLSSTLEVFGATVSEGSVDDLPPDAVVVDEGTAEDRGLELGDTVEVAFSDGATETLTLTAILEGYELTNGWWVAPDQIEHFAIPNPMQAFIEVAEGTDLTAAQDRVDEVLADEPEVGVTNHAEFIEQQTGALDSIVGAVQIL